MADKKLEQAKEFLYAQYSDEDKFKHNMKLLRAFGMFFGSIILMRNFGDLMAI